MHSITSSSKWRLPQRVITMPQSGRTLKPIQSASPKFLFPRGNPMNMHQVYEFRIPHMSAIASGVHHIKLQS
jgi:hypothetical protein